MQKVLITVLLLVLVIFHVLALERAGEEKNILPVGRGDSYVLPSPLLKITALEFDGLASDFMFLKALVFIGSTAERVPLPTLVWTPFGNEKKSLIEEWEWKWLYNVLNASVELDPYFLDPYYFANANLTWGGGLIWETNLLLEKGNRYRSWDWMMPFYIGFNNFYFLHDNDKAVEYLMEASRRPGGNPGFASLAAKLAYKENKTENSILLLEEILKTTKDEVFIKLYKTRLQALNGILFIEKAVAAYKQRFGKKPASLDALLQKQIIAKFPVDPYGGTYYIDPQGMVRTTSESKLMPAQH